MPNGRFVVVWVSQGQAQNQLANSDSIYIQLFDGSAKIGKEFNVKDDMAYNQADPALTALSGGGFLITYYQSNSSTHGYFGQKFDDNGQKVGSETFLFETNRGYPILAELSGGNLVMLTEGGSNGFFIQVADSSGAVVANDTLVDSYNGYYHTDMAPLTNGGFVVVWTSSQLPGTYPGIFGQRFNAMGLKVGTKFRIDYDKDTDSSYPSVASLPANGFIVTWSRGQSIYARIFDDSTEYPLLTRAATTSLVSTAPMSGVVSSLMTTSVVNSLTTSDSSKTTKAMTAKADTLKPWMALSIPLLSSLLRR